MHRGRDDRGGLLEVTPTKDPGDEYLASGRRGNGRHQDERKTNSSHNKRKIKYGKVLKLLVSNALAMFLLIVTLPIWLPIVLIIGVVIGIVVRAQIEIHKLREYKLNKQRQRDIIDAFCKKVEDGVSSVSRNRDMIDLLEEKSKKEKANIIKTLASKKEVSAENLAPLLKFIEDESNKVGIIEKFMKTHKATRDDLVWFIPYVSVESRGRIINCFLSNNEEYKLSNMNGKLEIINDIIKESSLQYDVDTVVLIYQKCIFGGIINSLRLHTYTPETLNTLHTLYPLTKRGDLALNSVWGDKLRQTIEVAIKGELQQKQISSSLNTDGAEVEAMDGSGERWTSSSLNTNGVHKTAEAELERSSDLHNLADSDQDGKLTSSSLGETSPKTSKAVPERPLNETDKTQNQGRKLQ